MSQDIREQVRESYGALIQKGSGCCGGGDRLATATAIGYAADDLRHVPAGAAENTFGCGNPLAFSGVEPGQVVLDLGAGAGLDVILAARKVGPTGRAIGVDMTPEMIARARENIGRAGLENAEIRQGYIEDLPVEDASVDWVVSNCVINLSPDKPRVFAEIARVLRPGGRFSISDIVVSHLPDWLRRLPAFHSACIGGAIEEAAYLQGLRDAGLTDVEVTARTPYGAPELRALVDSGEVPLPDDIPDDIITAALDSLAGKVQSIQVTGRKAVG